jgi:uncharacterized protein (DUF2252 family)
MRRFAGMGHLAVWYARADVDHLLGLLEIEYGAARARAARRTARKAHAKDSTRALARLTTEVEGELRFADDPPFLVRLADLVGEVSTDEVRDGLTRLLRDYRRSLAPEVRHLMGGYRPVDMARKVVGVGSVGTRAWVILLEGRDAGDPLVLQAKEAGPSVLEAHLRRGAYANHGRRVVEGQRFMQAASDVLLGWQRVTGIDGVQRDFYLRQLWDGKGSAAIETMDPEALGAYARLCAWTLARAHARSGDRVAIASYLGSGPVFDRAMVDFAAAYADQNERDFAALEHAVEAGRVVAAAPGA